VSAGPLCPRRMRSPVISDRKVWFNVVSFIDPVVSGTSLDRLQNLLDLRFPLPTTFPLLLRASVPET
jgi:hypothetical protein